MSGPLSVREIPLAEDLQLRVQAIEDPAQHGQRVLDIRLWRRPRAATAFAPTSAGLRLPIGLAELAADAIRDAAADAEVQR